MKARPPHRQRPLIPPGLPAALGLAAPPHDCRPMGSGHIHDTVLASYGQGTARRRYVHQRLNTRVFPEAEALMHNIQRVTDHLSSRLGDDADGRRSLRPVRTRGDGLLYRDDEGHPWRTYRYVENSYSVDVADTPARAARAARAFAEFSRLLSDLPPPPLHETIPAFHDTPARLHALEAAASEDPCNRALGAAPELKEAMSRAPIASLLTGPLARGEHPSRVCHNDTKLNNVLFDRRADAAICVIDLDTVMPGSVLYDFGDLVRTTVSPTAEDEADPDRISVREDFYAALAGAYILEGGGWLSDAELELIPLSSMVVSYEIALRFLTDHLQGDRYFKVASPGQNLVRARAQLMLTRALERAQDSLARITRRIGSGAARTARAGDGY